MFDEVRTPALLLDLDVLERNLERMAERCEALGVALRPHFKTHKCLEIARRQVARSGAGGTVATGEEARAFAAGGIDDLVWAVPLEPGKVVEAAAIKGSRLRVLVDDPATVAALAAHGARFDVAIKVDCGYHRAGVDPEGATLLELARTITDAPSLELGGLLTHSGHAYAVHGPEQARRVAEQERDAMLRAAERLEASGLPRPWLSVGSTPAMMAARDLSGIDEARPGNYALFDFMQVGLGSCRVADCAATVLTAVVSNAAGHGVIDAGALALSKDPGLGRVETYGEIFEPDGSGRLSDELRVAALSQEHGKLSAAVPVGTRLRVLPNHSCLTVAHFDEFVVVRGDAVVDRWPIHRAR